MTKTSNPFAWGGLVNNTARSIFADINSAAALSTRAFTNSWLQREFNGSLGANPLGPNVPPVVAQNNASVEREAAGYLGTGLSQTEVLAIGGAAVALVAVIILKKG